MNCLKYNSPKYPWFEFGFCVLIAAGIVFLLASGRYNSYVDAAGRPHTAVFAERIELPVLTNSQAPQVLLETEIPLRPLVMSAANTGWTAREAGMTWLATSNLVWAEIERVVKSK